MNNEKNFKRWSSIPKHLTPEERKVWEEDQEWREQEVERLRKQGFYKQRPKKKQIGWKTIRSIFKKDKKW